MHNKRGIGYFVSAGAKDRIIALRKNTFLHDEMCIRDSPMMELNLPVIGTITTLGTLMGLLGTVIGMIRSFAALSAGGDVYKRQGL